MIDDLDRKIIRVLNEDARKSYREMAKQLGISVTAVINRMKKFEDSGVIKGYIPVIDREYFGINLTALIALRLRQGNLLDIQKQIAQDDRIAGVYDITGEWDSLIIGYFKDRKDLNDFIKSMLLKNSVDRSITHIALNIVKEEKRVIV
ncbi:MAG: Lrp/AsnC family transcriptional regulator [Candidatus Aminicenantes bacterium]|nr:Lrp/AsnC family transcriptional regulator [Candidatus Aminicenantes bacterium]